MSRSSDERPLARNCTATRAGDRAAVEPLAALVAVLAVGAALGLYVVALDDASPERERPAAEATLDRIEPEVTVGGIVDPERLDHVEPIHPNAVVELEAGGRTWRLSGAEPPGTEGTRESAGVAVAQRSVTVRTGPGRNAHGRLLAVVRR
ncbi:DUF7285 family protein [Halorubrum trueperi]|uniref:Type IV pilin n=1 Tax=Halorubrum trueperi TaxID=2004704 RepID=A0ABD5UDW3_9EURY